MTPVPKRRQLRPLLTLARRKSNNNNHLKIHLLGILTNSREEPLVGEGKPIAKDESAKPDLDPEALAIKEYIEKVLKEEFTMADFPKIIEDLYSSDRFQQHYGAIGLRKLLSIEASPPIQPVIEAGVVPKLIQLMTNDKEPRLQVSKKPLE